MVHEPVQDPTVERAPDRICVECGHGESDHALQETEMPGATLRRTFCESCDGFHDFIPDPRDL